MAKPKSSAYAVVKVQRYLHQATAALHADKLNDCERHCRRALALLPEQPDGLHLLGIVSARRGRLSFAIDLLRRVLAGSPSDVKANNTLANLFYETGDLGGAERQYLKALALEPGHVSALYNLGLVQLLRGDSPTALKTLARAAALAPNDAHVQARYARALSEAGATDAAVSVGASATSLEPKSAEIWNEIGKINAENGRFEIAKDHYRTALKHNPRYARAALNLSKLQHFTTDDDPDAVLVRNAAAMEVTAGWQDQRDAMYALGKLCDDRGDSTAAFASYARANALHQRNQKAPPDAGHYAVRASRTYFDADQIARLGSVGCDDSTPIFIVGMPRSGTTLVEQILTAHPQVHAGGELQILDHLARDIPDRIGSRQPYPDCIAELTPRDCVAIGVDYVGRLRTHTAARERFITDKMPANYLHLGLIAMCLPYARIIWCDRDSMDIGLSIFFTDFGIGHIYATDLAAIGSMIRAVNNLGEYWRDALPIPILKVRYETLVYEPEQCIRGLLAHCGLEWHQNCLQPHRVQRKVHTASAWQVRQPVYTGSVARWKRYQDFLAPLRNALVD